jgi:hypothetical protein
MSDDETPAPGNVSASPAPIIRAGCVALIVVGAMTVFLAVPALFDPAGVRCSVARTFIDRANDDDRSFNDVDTGGQEVADLECPTAIQLAEQIRRNEDSEDTFSVPSESTIRTRSALILIVGAGQAVSAFATLRTLSRRARLAALVFATLGMLFAVAGLFSLAVLVFAVYALTFSGPSREIWPRPEGGRRADS